MGRNDLLIVDDDRDISYAYGLTLAAAGYEVSYAQTAEECLSAIAANPPALVLLDVSLPDRSGLDVCREIKANPACAGVFVVHVSGMRKQLRDVSAGFKAGADEYLLKPVSHSALTDCVDRLVRPCLPFEADAARVLVFELNPPPPSRSAKPEDADARRLSDSRGSPRSVHCARYRRCRAALYKRRSAWLRDYQPAGAPGGHWYFREHLDGRWSWHCVAAGVIRHSGVTFATIGNAMRDAERNGFVAERFREVVRIHHHGDGETH